MKYFLISLLLVSFAHASEINDCLLKQLGNDDFEVREAASAELSKLPFETLPKLIDLADREEDPEVQVRLRKGIYSIFSEHAYNHEPHILEVRTSADIQSCAVIVRIKYDKQPSDPNAVNSYNAEFIEQVDSGGIAKDKLKVADLLIKINGKNLPDFKFEEIEAGKAYDFTILRLKEGKSRDSNLTQIKDEDYETKIVSITPRLMDIQNTFYIQSLIGIAYKIYMKDYRTKK